MIDLPARAISEWTANTSSCCRAGGYTSILIPSLPPPTLDWRDLRAGAINTRNCHRPLVETEPWWKSSRLLQSCLLGDVTAVPSSISPRPAPTNGGCLWRAMTLQKGWQSDFSANAARQKPDQHSNRVSGKGCLSGGWVLGCWMRCGVVGGRPYRVISPP